ncbi:transcription initiation factor TFIID subunit 2, partial [Tremellales sp. Uapishka_1]
MADDGTGTGRGHQRNILDVDFTGVITATAHLTIHPTNPSLRTIFLHASPLLTISNVTLSSPTSFTPLLPTPASYTLSNPFLPVTARDPPVDIKSHPEIKRKTWAAMGERDEGELAISVSGGWVRLVENRGAGQDGHVPVIGLAPIHVQIDYQLVVGGDVIEGIVFRRPGDGGDDYQIPHMFLSPTTYDAARIWTPCVDNLWERCTWELEFVVPRYLEAGEPDGEEEEHPILVVASGELIEQISHPNDPHKVIFYFIQTNPTSVQQIAFAAGPFQVLSIPTSTENAQKSIIAYCLPGDDTMDLLRNSTSFLPKAMTYYTTEFGSYPFTAYKAVFVSNPRTACFTSATLSILSSELLFPENIIDQAIETRRILSLALIQQWMGINIIQKSLSDTWLVNGLALYISSLFIRHLLGNNEYRFRLKRDIDKCVRLDQGDQWPLSMPGALEPPDANVLSFINLKAPLVLHILDRHLAKAGTTQGLSRVIPRVFLSALSDEMSGNLLSTQSFFRTCRKVSGLDLQTFQDQWVLGSGCPHFRFETTFIKKKFIVNLGVQQYQPSISNLEKLPNEKQRKQAAWKRPAPFFEGSLTVRIHEADGAPFEHVVDIKQQFKQFSLPFNTKYKRTRRSGHVAARYNKVKDDLAATEADDPEEARLLDADRAEIFSYPPWEDEEERREWRVAEWTEEQAEQMLEEGGGYEWLRIDPELEWLARFEFPEKPWCWISQLQGDRDVVAQLEAIHNMTTHMSPVISSELTRTVLVKNYYYRVRMEAARALVVYNNPECDYIGLFHLLKLFGTLYCYPSKEDDEGDLIHSRLKPKPNDFSNLTEYFLKKSFIAACSEMRDPATKKVWKVARQLLLDLLNSNDNTTNDYSDSSYLATLIAAIGNAFITGAGVNSTIGEHDREQERLLLVEATEAVERAMTMDRLTPSYHNVVTQAGLHTIFKTIFVGLQVNNPRPFLPYTREGNYEPVRRAAFDCLLLCRPPGRSVFLSNYLMDVINHDYSLTIRRHVARGLSESILMSLSVGEIPNAVAMPSILDVTAERDQKEIENEQTAIVKAVRREFGKKLELRQLVQDALLESFSQPDMEVKFAMLKLAEIIASSNAEPRPGNIITIQTPTLETAPVLTPKIRLSMGGTPSAGIVVESAEYGFPEMTQAPTSAPIKLVLNTNKKKDKPLPKAQAGGLSENDCKLIGMAIHKMMSDQKSLHFRVAVDPVRDGAPDYLTIIRHPMDLGTVTAKFNGGIYTTRQDFVDDIKLIIANSLKYNLAGSPMYKIAQTFERFFNKLWSTMENTMTAAAERSAPGRTMLSRVVPLPPPAVPVAPTPAVASRPSILMPPPPLPAPSAIKIKLKPSKSVTIDAKPTQLSPMAPPPVPYVPKALPDVVRISASSAEKENKKRKKESRSSVLDALLGEEVDAMEKAHRPGSFGLEELVDQPKKKSKTPSATPPPVARQMSPEKTKAKPVQLAPAAPTIVLKKQARVSANPTPVPVSKAPATAFATPPSMWPTPPSDLPPTVQNSSTFKAKRSVALLKVLFKVNPEVTLFFGRPVDPVRDGCPTYLDEIREPMDFGSIQKKIDRKSYKSMGDLAYDIELVFANCRQFNPPGYIPDLVSAIESAYWKEWPKAVSSKMTPDERKAMISLLVRAMKEPTAVIFLVAVDPVALGIPNYFEVIPQEDARDLSLIRGKLNKQYTTFRQVDDDIDLMVENAKVFNEEGDVFDAAVAFQKWWNVQRSRMD